MNTRYYGIHSFPEMGESANIVIAQLPDLGRHHTELFLIAKEKLNGQILYLPEVEYDLLNQGVSREALAIGPFADTTFRKIHQILQVDYLLLVSLDYQKSEGSVYGYYTDIDLNTYRSYANITKQSRTGRVIFTLFDLRNATSLQFAVETTINPLIINDQENGEYRVNLTAKEKAGFVAFKKGLNKLR